MLCICSISFVYFLNFLITLTHGLMLKNQEHIKNFESEIKKDSIINVVIFRIVSRMDKGVTFEN